MELGTHQPMTTRLIVDSPGLHHQFSTSGLFDAVADDVADGQDGLPRLEVGHFLPVNHLVLFGVVMQQV